MGPPSTQTLVKTGNSAAQDWKVWLMRRLSDDREHRQKNERRITTQNDDGELDNKRIGKRITTQNAQEQENKRIESKNNDLTFGRLFKCFILIFLVTEEKRDLENERK